MIPIKLYTNCKSLYDAVHSSRSIDDGNYLLTLAVYMRHCYQMKSRNILDRNKTPTGSFTPTLLSKEPHLHSCCKCW